MFMGTLLNMANTVAFSHHIPVSSFLAQGNSVTIKSFVRVQSSGNNRLETTTARRPRPRPRPATITHHCCLPSPSSSPSSLSLPPTTATFVDPKTGSTVHVIGCVHGSLISADEVKKVISKTNPDVVVLELCEPRLSSLRKSVLRTAIDSPLHLHLQFAKNSPKNQKPRTFKQMTRTFRGVPQAILALILDGAYRLQVYSGLDPGIEFAYPIRTFAANKLVCGDDPARDTVGKLYQVFVSPLKSITVANMSLRGMFKRVVLPPDGGVTFWKVLTEGKRIRELGRLVLTASCVGFFIFLVGSMTAFAFEMQDAVVALNDKISVNGTGVGVTSGFGLSELFQLTGNVLQAMMMAYVSVSTLHFLKVLIIDRDLVIAKNIEDTLSRYSRDKRAPVIVCAVVGLLHVNGILENLRESSQAH